ncbi:MAG TPA: MBL fold metallo-hydrolase, partial [Polyangiaceae bacterium]
MQRTLLYTAAVSLALTACQGIVRGAIKSGINDGLAVAGPAGSDFEKLADDLYTYRWLGYRTAFVTTPDGVILFDPLNARASAEIKAQLARLAPRNPHVKIIIYSHNHADHESGAAVFADDAPRIIATANAAADIAAHPSPEVVAPTETFAEADKTLTFGGV